MLTLAIWCMSQQDIMKMMFSCLGLDDKCVVSATGVRLTRRSSDGESSARRDILRWALW